jgi:hypothetical protein
VVDLQGRVSNTSAGNWFQSQMVCSQRNISLYLSVVVDEESSILEYGALYIGTYIPSYTVSYRRKLMSGRDFVSTSVTCVTHVGTCKLTEPEM